MTSNSTNDSKTVKADAAKIKDVPEPRELTPDEEKNIVGGSTSSRALGQLRSMTG